jgi:hypothetical protein
MTKGMPPQTAFPTLPQTVPYPHTSCPYGIGLRTSTVMQSPITTHSRRPEHLCRLPGLDKATHHVISVQKHSTPPVSSDTLTQKCINRPSTPAYAPACCMPSINVECGGSVAVSRSTALSRPPHSHEGLARSVQAYSRKTMAPRYSAPKGAVCEQTHQPLVSRQWQTTYRSHPMTCTGDPLPRSPSM